MAGRAGVVPWLLGIARNHLRRSRHRRPTESLPDDDSLAARTLAIDADPLVGLARRQHVDAMTGSTGEQDLVSALRRLAQDTEVPPPDPQAERALLEAFDAAWEQKRARMRSRLSRPVAAAALLALAATVVWMMASRSGRAPAPTPSAVAPLATNEFVVWPGSAELPTFESGHLMRMELPVSALPSLGLVPQASQAAVVYADVLVGQDGLPRAVRLSPDF